MLYQGAAFTAHHLFYSVVFCMVMHDAYVEIHVRDWNFLRCSTCFFFFLWECWKIWQIGSKTETWHFSLWILSMWLHHAWSGWWQMREEFHFEAWDWESLQITIASYMIYSLGQVRTSAFLWYYSWPIKSSRRQFSLAKSYHKYEMGCHNLHMFRL